ncbi:MAG: SUMF1/EgtB/PvdO family nonheme iron enzyme [Bacteroidales bacterium]|nr:SUMF1/EgtB/PvdO family nonheme iron enzyme [Bacteroidales bacterium]
MNRIAIAFVLAAACLGAYSCKTRTVEPKGVDYELNYKVGDVSFEMLEMPSGNFTMGLSPDNRSLVKGAVAHEVALDGFVISAKPVSQALWTEIMGDDPSSVKNPDAPVDMVSWNDVQKFIKKLCKVTGKEFFLPTEAQWEYACNQVAKQGFVTVSEWCGDPFAEDSDPMVLALNPSGPAAGDVKVVRNPSARVGVDCHTRKAGVGFRLAQLSGDKLSEQMLGVLDGQAVDREKVDASVPSPEVFTVGGVTFKMVKVKGGSFQMGFTPESSPAWAFSLPENESPAHQVTLDDFELGETEVTVGLWKAVMGSVPYLNDVNEPDFPIGNVSWYNCQTFIRKLNALTGRKFRLPTEAEWEYAARGGSASRNYAFSGSNDPWSCMWFLDNAGMKPRRVGNLKANELGLKDMSGNVWEWVFDRPDTYTEEAKDNPSGAASGGNRVLRGGSNSSKWEACRVSNRSFMPAKNVKGTFGFRLAL